MYGGRYQTSMMKFFKILHKKQGPKYTSVISKASQSLKNLLKDFFLVKVVPRPFGYRIFQTSLISKVFFHLDLP